MSTTHGYKEAYPTHHRNGASSGGFSKREKMALEIMTSITDKYPNDMAAELAVDGADALIEELNK